MKLSNLKLATQLVVILSLITLFVSALYFGLIFYSQWTTKAVFDAGMKATSDALDESGQKLQTDLDGKLEDVKKDVGTTVQTLSTNVIDNLAWQVRGETGMFVERAVGQTRNFANTVRVYLQETPKEQRDRKALLKFLGAHVSDPDFCGGGICFEPNVFDGKDEAYKYDEKKDNETDVKNKKELGCSETGRFIPWVTVEKGKLAFSPLDNPDEDASGYYTEPKKTKQEFVTPPYDYLGTVMITVAIPVLDGENLLAVVTTDLDAIHLENILSKHKPFGTGFAYLVDDTGKIVWHPNKKIILEKLSDLPGREKLDECVKKAEFGHATIPDSQDPTKQMFQTYVPIKFGRSPKTWGVIVSAVVQDFMKAATETGGKIDILETDVNTQVGALKSKVDDANKAAEQQMQKNNAKSTYIVIGASVVIILLTVVIAVFVGRSFASPIARSVAILRGIAERGEISATVPKDIESRGDEIGDLGRGTTMILTDYRNVAKAAEVFSSGDWTADVVPKSEQDQMSIAIKKLAASVNTTLKEVGVTVKQVATGAGEVSNASQALSSGAQESAASLEEITASMSEISGQTKANAKSATEARDLAQQASQAAAQGQDAMRKMNESMERITKNSGEIQRVIKVIDDIAFQTNLLALNAAVEAARAGQHGKGFAVVAEEVRNLASRSAKAAQETSALIATSGQEIQKGGEVAEHTGEVLNTIVEQIKRTTDLVSEIAVASNEQAQGVNQVTVGLQQIDAVTQQNTASAEESASAANEMSATASDLQKLVSQFKLR